MITIPLLDLSRFQTDRTAFIQEVGQAYKEFGFCRFYNHGIDPGLIDDVYQAFKNFFFLPSETKLRYFSPDLVGKRGYTPFKKETAKNSNHPDLKEFWHVGRSNLPENHPYHSWMHPNIWPYEVPNLHRVATELYSEMEQLGREILSVLALAIDLPEHYFDDKTQYGNSILRALHYPPIQTNDAPCIRAQAHEDISLITLLLGAQGGGLEVQHNNGQWIPIVSSADEIVVNVGDMMQRLTNHVYRSTTHRVVNPDHHVNQSRFSLPFFMDPNPDFLITTLPQCITPDNPNRYPQPILANDYLIERLTEIKLVS